ncbi:MAG TPA: M20/M25/M40 family metallo-hydrolase [Tepidisphaeraceae bacterium]|nr:M20/M25/M40 family metallo-hydrolase [Tepidisphaeraceae bacterium]
MSAMYFKSKALWLSFLLPWIPLVIWGCAGSDDSSEDQARAMAAASTRPIQPVDLNAIARIRDEGLNHSQVMETASYLTDVIGPRLTGSPNLKRANEWTRDKLTSWGLQNAHLEAWGPFGRGWSMKRFSAEVIEPQSIPLIAAPSAWSPGFDQPLEAEVVMLDPRTPSDLDAYAGKLAGKIVLVGGERPVKAHFSADGTRYTDDELTQLAARGARGPATSLAELLQNAGRRGAPAARGPASNPAVAANIVNQIFNFAARENAALICSPSTIGDGGTIFVQSARSIGTGAARGPTSVWSVDPNQIPPQITVSVEQFNRMARMIKAGEKLKMAVNLKVETHNDDPMAYNTIAEIPGTDLKEQVVMLGGHMDSWHTGTGATDNGIGVSVAMEAVRIIKSLNLKPRRTIRIALWTGEEEGLFGSAAYMKQHFGQAIGGRGAGGGDRGTRRPRGGATSAPAGPRVDKQPEYDSLSAYFNLDNGTGKIRGIYCQGNVAVAPIFKQWLKSFSDLGANTITLSNTSGTDHLSFDAIGLPGFQFIQDPIEYSTRTHHSNQDVFDRIQADDMKQASTIMAAFVYNAAMMDQRIPRKPGY